ncbi:MAG: hypothetical protein PHG02_04840 [Oscillospiraceae bacterium]|nr:hypothetical protein [Oscillospiraceae bacterium]
MDFKETIINREDLTKQQKEEIIEAHKKDRFDWINVSWMWMIILFFAYFAPQKFVYNILQFAPLILLLVSIYVVFNLASNVFRQDITISKALWAVFSLICHPAGFVLLLLTVLNFSLK